jgi:hypothetical protein
MFGATGMFPWEQPHVAPPRSRVPHCALSAEISFLYRSKDMEDRRILCFAYIWGPRLISDAPLPSNRHSSMQAHALHRSSLSMKLVLILLQYSEQVKLRRVMCSGTYRCVASWALLPTCFAFVSYYVYSSSLKIKAICSSETSADFQQTSWHIPGERTLRNRCCENITAYI